MPTAIHLSSRSLPDAARVISVHGVEAMSRPFELTIGLRVPSGIDVDLLAVVGARATLEVGGDLVETPHRIHGLIATFEHVHEHDGYASYLAVLVPRLWDLSLEVHSRVFTEASVPEIVQAVLRASLTPIDVRLELHESYATLEHVGQYRETNLDFVQRLLEREGISYWFDHDGDAEVLVLTDRTPSRSARGPVRYEPLVGEGGRGEALETFSCRVRSLPGGVRLQDYDPLHPTLKLSGTHAVVPVGRGSRVSWGENFRTPEEGARLARVRGEELSSRRQVFSGEGNVMGLRSGHAFTLEQHPRSGFNAEYVVLELEHCIDLGAPAGAVKRRLVPDGADDRWHVRVTAVPRDVALRPERVTPVPRIDGVVDGVVDGTVGGPYAEIDAHGRYKVKLFFDESDLVDGSASTWIRMLQPHGGEVEGFHFPLRKGTEVHVTFLGGDPDRPVIVGVAPNAHRASPVTSGNHMLNVVQSGGGNRLEMMDVGGGQYTTLSSPTASSFLHLGSGGHQLEMSTSGQGKLNTGANLDVRVGANKDEDVTGTVNIHHGAAHTATVVGATTRKFLSSVDDEIVGFASKLYKAATQFVLQGAHTQQCDATYDLTVGGAATVTYDSTLDLTVTGALTETYESTRTLTVSGLSDETFESGRTTVVTGSDDLQVDGPQSIVLSAGQTVRSAADLVFSAAGSHMLTAPAAIAAHATLDFARGLGYETDWTALAIVGLQQENIGVALNTTGVMMMANGVMVTAAGINLGYWGVSVESKATEVRTAGMSVLGTALHAIF